MAKLYRAAIDKDWETFLKCFKDDKTVVSPVTGNTALHLATRSGKLDLVTKLEELAQPGWRALVNNHGDTVLHEVAAFGDVKMAGELLRDNKDQLTKRNNAGETPLFRAAVFNKPEMVNHLAAEASDISSHDKQDGTPILHTTLLAMKFDSALEFLRKDESLLLKEDKNGMAGLQLLANMPYAFKSGHPMNILEKLLYHCIPDKNHWVEKTFATAISDLYKSFWRSLDQGFPSIGRLTEIKKQHNSVLEVLNFLVHDMVERDKERPASDKERTESDKLRAASDKKKGAAYIKRILGIEREKATASPSQNLASSSAEPPIISAARNGIIEIVKCILKVYPPATEVTNDQGESIFHVVARHRRKEILDYLQHFHAPQSTSAVYIDSGGDSILHQAAYHDKHQLKDRPGEALHLQADIQWFKRVRKLVPPYLLHFRNKENKTAEELFAAEHERPVEHGRAWLLRTTKAFTIVAILITTVACTCAYNITAGSNSKKPHRLTLKDTAFRTFSVSDSLSSCFSFASVVLFLSILTSKMREQDFETSSLLLKLALGLSTLFFGVAAMMVAFAAAVVLVVRERLQWGAVPIYTVASCPVAIFLALQLPLYLNVWSTLCGNT